jgi:hypothetical protein
LLLALLSSAVEASESGERFVTPWKPDASWELVRDPSRPTTSLWKSRENERDQIRIESFPGSPESLVEVRMTLDAPGKASCARFDTTTIRDSPVNGYPRLLWRTDCTKDEGPKGTFLNLAVRGRDALHLAVKIWQFDVAESEVDAWIRRFESSFVCDPRSEHQGCPEDAAKDG